MIFIIREVKSIELVLENCESFTINRNHIGDFYVGGIERSVRRIACNSISEDYSAKSFNIRIHKNANVKTGYKDVTVFERIKSCNDITQIIITYDNDTYDNLFINWTGDSCYSNEAQKSEISKVNGDLFIVIDENETVDSLFKNELTEDDNFSWEMYSE